MNRFSFVYMTVLFFLSCTICTAETSWNMKDCIEYALSSNAEIQMEQMRIEQAKNAVRYQQRMFFPALGFSAASGYLDGQPTSSFSVVNKFTEEGLDTDNKSGYYLTGELVLDVPLFQQGTFIGGRTPAYKAAVADLTADTIGFELKKRKVFFDIGQAFLNLVKSKQAYDLAEKHVSSLRLYYKAATAKFDEEMISRNELLVADVNLAIGLNKLELAQNLLDLSTDDLKITMGFPEKSELIIDKTPMAQPALPAIASLIEEALNNSLELERQKQIIGAAREAQRQTHSELYPNIDFVTVYSTAYDFEDTRPELWKSYITMSFPLFDRGLSRMREKMTETQLLEKEKQLIFLQNQIKKDVYMAYAKVKDALANRTLAEKKVEQSMENVRLIRARFKLELTDLGQLLEAEYSLQNNENDRNEAIFNILSALWKLQYVTGADLFFTQSE